ncbi:MAG: glycoside hydrolase family 2 protein [Candidatus Omnitrophica bacterium]|nr:glycoside hydrolase family 2 protein [Candidatus Omnitrophota bacterium]
MKNKKICEKETISLDGKWRLVSFEPGEGKKAGAHKPGYPVDKWLGCSVPGSAQGALLSAGKIPSPFVGIKAEDKYRFIEEKEWWFAREFKVNKKLTDKTVFLKFHGIDTVSAIYLNGKKTGETCNMFIPYEFRINDFLRNGKNVLAVRLDPVGMAARRKDKKNIIETNYWLTASFIRKANFAYGKDMSYRMITAGIWRPVEIAGYGSARISNVHIVTNPYDKYRKAKVSVCTGIENFSSRKIPVSLRIRIVSKKGELPGKDSFKLQGTLTERKVSFDIPNPELWWPNGTGEQNLYTAAVELLDAQGNTLDMHEERFGIREIKLIQDKDRKEGGETFIFAVNGKQVFAKGVNWVPADTLMYPIPAKRYRDLITAAKEANFNMFRINGFGIYEDEEFYRACDEAGIMIWQDFMFSDCMYNDKDKEFLDECQREGETVVKMLRNHPCIALWCGNNEVDEMYYTGASKDWRWQEAWGEKIFHRILPEICRKFDPSRPYWPSSAWSAPGKYPLWNKMGDYHFYPVSCGGFRPVKHPHGRAVRLPLSLENTSYRLYAKEKAKFYSEFGIGSIPCMETVKKSSGKMPLWPMNNDFWTYYLSVGWPRKFLEITSVLNTEFGNAKNPEEYIFYSQLGQALTFKFAMEHFRVRKPSCGGGLFWMYNDCWPTETCSIIDYYSKKKIAYYWAKKACSPLMLAFIETEKKDRLELWAVNDGLSEVEGEFLLSRRRFKGKTLSDERMRKTIPANCAMKLQSITIPRDIKRNEEFLNAEFLVSGKTAADNRYFFSIFRDRKIPACNVTWSADRKSPGEFLINLETDVYACMVNIDTGKENYNLSDNWFDIMKGEKKIVSVKTCKAPAVKITVFNGKTKECRKK